MESTINSNEKYYFVHIRGREIIETFRALAHAKDPAKVWLKGENDEVEDYIIDEFDEKRMRLFLIPTARFAKLIQSKKLGKKLYLRLGKNNLLTFTTSVLEKEKGGSRYFVRADKAVYRSLQRTNYRLLSDSYNKIAFQVDGEIFEVIDLSAGGISLLISKEEKEYFVKERELKECIVFLNSKKYDVSVAKVVSTWEERSTAFESTGNVEVGIQFTDLSEEVEEVLSRDINAQAREAEVRKTFLKGLKKS